MIDWDYTEIEKIDKHYKEILNPSVNLIYFCNHYEEIIRISMAEEVLLPDIFNDITYYTINGVNARYKVLVVDEENISEKLLPQRMKQRAQRQKAHNMGINEYYQFMIKEVEEFVEKYPFWKDLIRR